MKKLLLIIVLAAVAASFAMPSSMAQVTISYYSEVLSGAAGIKNFNCDSLYFNNGWLYAYKDGMPYTIDDMRSINAPSTEENRRILKELDEYYVSVMKKRCKNQAIGCFATGTAFIFFGNIIADSYLDKKSDNISIDDDWKKIRRNGKIIRYSLTGLGGVFQIIGVSKTVKLASDSSFSYGISDNGITLTYKFR